MECDVIPDCLSPSPKEEEEDEVDPLRTNNENCDSLSDESCIYEGALNAQIISSADATFIIHTISDSPTIKKADQIAAAPPPPASRRTKAATTTVKNNHTNNSSSSSSKKTLRVNSSSSSSAASLPPFPPSAQAQQASTMREVLASIPGFSIKPRRRTNKKMSTAAQIEQTREGCIDLETPDSILCGANLRDLLNKHTFSMLPPFYQYKLVQLLPPVDRPGHADNRFTETSQPESSAAVVNDADDDQSIRLKASSLNNEFFARACLEWRERLSEGEFTPENQMKLRAEAEREKNKLDPWKLKHFEPIWGCCSGSGGVSRNESAPPRFQAPPTSSRSLRNPPALTTTTSAASTSPSTRPTRSTRTVGAVTRSTTASTSSSSETIEPAKLSTPPMPDLLPIRAANKTATIKEDTVIISLDDDDDEVDQVVEEIKKPIDVDNSAGTVGKRAQKRSVTPDVGQGKVGKFTSDVPDCSGGSPTSPPPPEELSSVIEPIKMETTDSEQKSNILPIETDSKLVPPPPPPPIVITTTTPIEKSIIETKKSEKIPILIEITSIEEPLPPRLQTAPTTKLKNEFGVEKKQPQLIELNDQIQILSNVLDKTAATKLDVVELSSVITAASYDAAVPVSVVVEEHAVIMDEMKVVAAAAAELVEITVPTTATLDSNASDEVEALEPTIQNLDGLVEDDPIEQKFTDAENYVLESGEISADSGG